MKRLWILNHYAIPPAYAGGTRHYDLARHLLHHGYDVTILASSFHHVQRRETGARGRGLYAVEEVDGIKFVWLRTIGYEGNDWRRLLNMLSYFWAATLIGRRLPSLDPRVSKPDVIIGSSVHLFAVLSAHLLSRHFRAHFLMEVRDLWPQTLVDLGVLTERSLVTHMLRVLETYLYRRAERIIVLLPNASDYIAGLGINGNKIRWIPNGVDTTRFRCRCVPAGETSGFTLMYVGAHGRVNALNVLIDAAEIVRSQGYSLIRFVLVGDGPEKMTLVQNREERGLENVIFRDPVPKEAVPSVLEEADALVFVLQDLALYKYGISLNKVFDYMAAGKPIILAGKPVNNIVAEAGCGLSVAPNDPAALARAIIDLYNMPAQDQADMSRRGREYVEQHHDYALLASSLDAVVQELDSAPSEAGDNAQTHI